MAIRVTSIRSVAGGFAAAGASGRASCVAHRDVAQLAGVIVLALTFAGCWDSDDGRRSRGGARTPVGPPVACTLIGCDDGLKVALDPPSGWPEGRYSFDVEADGERASCTGSLPLPACATGTAKAITCDRSDLVRIVESGCALPAQTHGFPELWFDSKLRPTVARITVSRNGEVIGEAEIRPQFQTSQPNGPDCPPVCHTARATVLLRF